MCEYGKVLGITAAVLLASPMARAHLLECEKVVNGTTLLELSEFPETLDYTLTIRNIHPFSASTLTESSDPLLEGEGWSGFPNGITIPLGEEVDDTFSIELGDYDDCIKLAAKDGTADDVIDNTFTVRWDSGSAICGAQVLCIEDEQQQGQRMTGGGSVFGTGRNRVTHGFQLRCDENDPRQNLEVNWQGNQFHLLDLTTADCTDDPALDEENPVAGFDTFTGTGTGRYNGVEGATIEFIFTDDGEPGSDDRARIVVRDEEGDIVLSVDGDLNFGNHQAHP